MPALGRPTTLALPAHAPAQLPAHLPARTPAHVCVCTNVHTFSPQVRRRSDRRQLMPVPVGQLPIRPPGLSPLSRTRDPVPRCLSWLASHWVRARLRAPLIPPSSAPARRAPPESSLSPRHGALRPPAFFRTSYLRRRRQCSWTPTWILPNRARICLFSVSQAPRSRIQPRPHGVCVACVQLPLASKSSKFRQDPRS